MKTQYKSNKFTATIKFSPQRLCYEVLEDAIERLRQLSSASSIDFQDYVIQDKILHPPKWPNHQLDSMIVHHK